MCHSTSSRPPPRHSPPLVLVCGGPGWLDFPGLYSYPLARFDGVVLFGKNSATPLHPPPLSRPGAGRARACQPATRSSPRIRAAIVPSSIHTALQLLAHRNAEMVQPVPPVALAVAVSALSVTHATAEPAELSVRAESVTFSNAPPPQQVQCVRRPAVHAYC
jgi:hypothetical protein